VGWASLNAPAFAHHPFGGETPQSGIEGFLSGLGHPIIGLDHFIFVIGAGLLAALKPKGLVIPVGFVAATLVGTGIHLAGVDLPAPESIISLSVLLLGVVLALRESPHVFGMVALAAIAGVFHGYAYGEAIVGAEMTPLISYLLGFGLIQLLVALGSAWVAKTIMNPSPESPGLPIRFAGFAILGAGFAFFSSILLG
jgi:urease accessory protein